MTKATREELEDILRGIYIEMCKVLLDAEAAGDELGVRRCQNNLDELADMMTTRGVAIRAPRRP